MPNNTFYLHYLNVNTVHLGFSTLTPLQYIFVRSFVLFYNPLVFLWNTMVPLVNLMCDMLQYIFEIPEERAIVYTLCISLSFFIAIVYRLISKLQRRRR